ncbi:MAG TPA: hypothetical protein VNJ05_07355 [Sphingomicrobium sp.]|nr:hypothetical protein [Sphingomicrobium sp.]
MRGPGNVIGWQLDRGQREELLRRFPPRYPDAIADHVTLKAGAEHAELPKPVEASIVGRCDDQDSLECLVVEVDGTTDRPDGSIFHITWSLDKSKGRKARESNDVLKERGWTSLGNSIPIQVDPAKWP